MPNQQMPNKPRYLEMSAPVFSTWYNAMHSYNRYPIDSLAQILLSSTNHYNDRAARDTHNYIGLYNKRDMPYKSGELNAHVMTFYSSDPNKNLLGVLANTHGLSAELHDILIVLENCGLGTYMYDTCRKHYMRMRNENMVHTFDWTEYYLIGFLKTNLKPRIPNSILAEFINHIREIPIGNHCRDHSHNWYTYLKSIGAN